MKALVFEAPKRAIVADLEQPRISPDEVLIRSQAVGICHSDFELLDGHYIIPISYPVIPGHEWAGEVVAVLGAGPIGLLCTLAAAASNAAVVVVETQQGRRDKALQLGARLALDPAAANFTDAVSEATVGRGFDVVIEATGSPGAM